NGSNIAYEHDSNGQIIGAFPSDGPHIRYQYNKDQRLIQKEKPEGRTLNIEYGTQGRVKAVSVPSHADGSLATVLKIEYKPSNDNRVMITKAFDPWGRFKAYHSVDKKVKLIVQQKPDDSGAYTIGELFWGDPKGNNPGSLMAFAFKDSNRDILFAKKYHYDDRGNPIKEELWGNLTGKDEIHPRLDEHGHIVTPKREHHTITKGYTQKKNLLTSEDDGVKQRELFYHLDTDMIAKELVRVDGEIQERHFFLYDEDLALTDEIIDDGSSEELSNLSGVTQRKRLKKRYDNPLLGLPNEESVFFLNLVTGEEVLSARKEISYNQRGRITSERVFDEDNAFMFELVWEYDDHGNVIREVSALGTEMIRRYDANDNLIYEAGPLFDHERHFKYDRMDRLIEETEIHGDEVFTTSHLYNIVGQKINTIDRYGAETRYEYDFVGRIKAIHEPEGKTIKKSYHPTGYVHTLTDPAGGVTSFKQTIRGKPYEASYPDGTKEFWEYDLLGNLIRHTDKGGLTQEYSYDYKGRVIEEKFFDIEGQLVYNKTKRYTPFSLLSETDEMGITTHYEYNFKGQLIRSEKNGLQTKYFYNSRGQLAKKVTQDELVETFQYDFIGRVTQETKEDSEGRVLLFSAKVYDDAGRVISETKGDFTTFFIYNSKGELVEKIAPDGKKSRYEYDHNFLNPLGQTVILKKAIDPTGAVSEVEFDHLKREVRSARYDPFGKLIQQSFKTYDLLGNLASVKEDVIWQGEKEKEIEVTFSYDPMGRPKEVIQEKGSLYERGTFTEYNTLGQKIRVAKPNGAQIVYTYDAMGRVKEEKSSDGTVDYLIDYDVHSRPIHVLDKVHGTDSSYTYDEEGRLIKEALGTQEWVENGYDSRGRLTKVQHSRIDPIHLSYDALYLREVAWKDLRSKYEAYDLAGNLLEGNETTYSYDKANRMTGWKRGEFEENLSYDNGGNLAQRNQLGLETSYAYDELNQLKEETGASNKTYSSDSHYTRRSKDGESYILDALDHPIAFSGSEYEWDRNGNLIARTENGIHTTLRYDARDRLIAVISNGNEVSYLWDEQNRCLKAGERHFLYQGRAEVGSVINNELQDFRVLGLGRGQEASASVWVQIQDALFKPLHDLSGNMIALTDLDDTLIEYNPLTAFGESLTDSPPLCPWSFSSKRLEANSGLILFGYRFYDRALGRFTTADPAGYDAGPNLWAYCHNNPLVFSDLFGLCPHTILHENSPSHDDHSQSSDASHEQADDKTSGFPDLESCCLGHMLESGAKLICYAVGTGIETVAFHAIPRIPGVKDIPMGAAHFMKEGCFCNYVPVHLHNNSRWITTGTVDNPKHKAPYNSCGIMTSPKDAQERGSNTSNLLNGEKSKTFSTGTHGAVTDLISCMLDFLGFQTHAARVFKEGLENDLTKMGPNAIIDLSTFSRANIIARNTFDSWKKEGKNYSSQINLFSMASPVMIQPDACRSVRMGISSRDGVCLLMGLDRWFPPFHLSIYPSDAFPGLDHNYDGKVYQLIYINMFLQPYINR
ncbi:MAG: RHS repeat-associated core domain-containing protein, partial [Chlamydiia bacterium]|nr:RHS repeat-associated core domain-containing protein [Chlamydiia bacterium]